MSLKATRVRIRTSRVKCHKFNLRPDSARMHFFLLSRKKVHSGKIQAEAQIVARLEVRLSRVSTFNNSSPHLSPTSSPPSPGLPPLFLQLQDVAVLFAPDNYFFSFSLSFSLLFTTNLSRFLELWQAVVAARDHGAIRNVQSCCTHIATTHGPNLGAMSQGCATKPQ